MSEKTKIEWCDHTVNLVWGCEKVSPACANCYAEGLAKRFAKDRATWGKDGLRWIRHEAARRELYKLDASALGDGCRRRVFINSMSDTFEDRPDLNEARQFLWDACRWVTNLDILLLTKRPENIARMLPADWGESWSDHVWLGTTVEGPDQERRIWDLLDIPARVHFLSCEPMLGALDIAEHLGSPAARDAAVGANWIDWVICGGESGPNARQMYPAWALSLRDQCQAAGVPFFFKQWGKWQPYVDEERFTYGAAETNANAHVWMMPDGEEGLCWIRDDDGTWQNWTGEPPCEKDEELMPGMAIFSPVGKKRAGRMLDGHEYSEFPETHR